MTQLLTMGHFMWLEYLVCCFGETVSSRSCGISASPCIRLPCPEAPQEALDAYT